MIKISNSMKIFPEISLSDVLRGRMFSVDLLYLFIVCRPYFKYRLNTGNVIHMILVYKLRVYGWFMSWFMSRIIN